MNIVILAGGQGTRLWPVSRKNQPKQAKRFFNGKTLLQLTYQRISHGFKKDDIYISCGKNQFGLLKKQVGIKKTNFILEPFAKGTAMAIGLACIKLAKKNPDAILAMANSDHFIKDEKEYFKVLKLAHKLVQTNPEHLVLIGLNPKYPETAYGYIELGKLFRKIAQRNIFYIKRFKEKPNLKQAQKYLKSGNFLWNPAWFVFKAEVMLNLFEKYLPKHYQALKNIEKKIGTREESQCIEKEFKKVDSISIDYGIIEKAKNMLLIPSSLEWRDVGTWDAVGDIFYQKNQNDILIDSQNTLVINKNKNKLISVLGVSDLIVVDTKDALMICKRSESQNIKKIIKELKTKKKLNKYL